MSYSSDTTPSRQDDLVFDDRSNLSLQTEDLSSAGQRRVQPYSTSVERDRPRDSSASSADYQGSDRSYG